jgi:uncharacterized delta-60 repeat protein
MRHTMEYRNWRDHARLVPWAPRQTRPGMLAALLLLPAAGFAHQDGKLDSSFGAGGKVLTDFQGSNDEGNALVRQPDGRVVVVGSTHDPATGLSSFGLARYRARGSLDATFGGDGRVITDFGSAAIAQAVALQNDGKIVVGGYRVNDAGSSFALARYLPNGALDVSFDGDGKVSGFTQGQVHSLLLQPDGKIIATGGLTIARYLPDGSLDGAFGNAGIVTSSFEQLASALQPDGKIVTAGGVFDSAIAHYRFAVARYLPNGAADMSFDGDGRVITDAGGDGFASDVVLQGDGRIVTAGAVFNASERHYDFALVRYLLDGTLDAAFSGDGWLTTNFGGSSEVSAVTLQPDGKIVAAGYAFSSFALARYRPDGALDASFSGDGLVMTTFGEGFISFARGVVSTPDGGLVAVGAAAGAGEGSFDFALARYKVKY